MFSITNSNKVHAGIYNEDNKLEDTRIQERLINQFQDDFQVVEEVSLNTCQVTWKIGCGLPTIKMWPGLKEADDDAYHFLLTRQIYFLESSHKKMLNLSAMCAAVASACFAYQSNNNMNVLNAILVLAPMVLATTVYVAYDVLQFNQADRFAIQNCTSEQLLGGLRYLKSIKKIRFYHLSEYAEQYLSKNHADGYYISNFYPAISTRIRNIQNELARRSYKIDDSAENKLINKELRRKIGNAIVEQLPNKFDQTNFYYNLM